MILSVGSTQAMSAQRYRYPSLNTRPDVIKARPNHLPYYLASAPSSGVKNTLQSAENEKSVFPERNTLKSL